MDCRFLIIWDHHGSGREAVEPATIEKRAVERLGSVGVSAEHVRAISFRPELECAFKAVWPRVKAIVAAERGVAPPEDVAILAEVRRMAPWLQAQSDFGEALERFPKELFEALIRLVRLRKSAPLYQKIGSQISLPGVKKEPAASRIAGAISLWFPPAT
jgi:hypothetical protein